MTTIKYEGHLHFRQRLLLATLAGKAVRIDKIRHDDPDFPGLADYEVSFLRLLEKITNGSTIEISYTGTSVLYKPGVIIGGTVTHDCPSTRAIGYFLEPLIPIAPFAKTAFNLTLNGITNDNLDFCIDTIRTVTLPVLQKFLPEIPGTFDASSLELKVCKRGAPPLGGGQVVFKCPLIKSLASLSTPKVSHPLIEAGRGVKKIRGVAYATRISPQMANRVVDSSRSLLTRYIPDVYIYNDVYKGAESGKSPGYGISLVAETTNGMLYSAECSFQPRKKNISDVADENEVPPFSLDGIATKDEVAVSSVTTSATREGLLNHLLCDSNFPTPEDLGVRASRLLLTELAKSSNACFDTHHQSLALLLCAIGPRDVRKVRLGCDITKQAMSMLRDVKVFFGCVFKLEEEEIKDKNTIVATCVGVGLVNVNKNVT